MVCVCVYVCVPMRVCVRPGVSVSGCSHERSFCVLVLASFDRMMGHTRVAQASIGGPGGSRGVGRAVTTSFCSISRGKPGGALPGSALRYPVLFKCKAPVGRLCVAIVQCCAVQCCAVQCSAVHIRRNIVPPQASGVCVVGAR